MKKRFKKYMTKSEVMEGFKSIFPEIVNSDDKPLKRMTWNDHLDSLRKDGTINPKSDWCHPSFIKN